ncbi:MAG: hypothetical protein HN790_05690 [Methylococcales bacterium]|nr:hypothetical protein [Methylococcales bacterium]
MEMDLFEQQEQYKNAVSALVGRYIMEIFHDALKAQFTQDNLRVRDERNDDDIELFINNVLHQAVFEIVQNSITEFDEDDFEEVPQ